MSRRLTFLGLAVTIAITVGCGSDDEGGSEAGDETAELTVAAPPTGDVSPLFLGIEQGFFEEQELEIETQFAESGAVTVPAAIQGSIQAGVANSVTVLSALGEGLDLRVVGMISSGGTMPEHGYSPLMVKRGTGIETAADLDGRTVAVSSLDSIEQITTQEALENEGADVSSVEFLEVPRADMIAALDAGRVDAAVLVEPFGVQATATGDFEPVLDTYVDAYPNVPVAVYFTSGEYATENEDVINRFSEALAESLAFAADNPDAVRENIPTFTEITPALAEEMTIPQWVPPGSERWDRETAIEQMSTLAELAVKWDVFAEAPDVESLFSSYPE